MTDWGPGLYGILFQPPELTPFGRGLKKGTEWTDVPMDWLPVPRSCPTRRLAGRVRSRVSVANDTYETQHGFFAFRHG